MAGGRLGHAVLAGAVGGSAIACGVATGPLLAAAFDVAAAALTAGIAAHAVEVSARERGVPSAGVLRRAARTASQRCGAPLAAHAAELVERARSRDVRALRSAAILLGRATTAHARGLAFQAFGSWSAPFRDLTQLVSPFRAARAALESAEFVRAMVDAVPEPVGLAERASGAERPRTDPFPVVTVEPVAAASEGDDAAASPAPQENSPTEEREEWEVAA